MLKEHLICFDVRIGSISVPHNAFILKKMHHDLVVIFSFSGNKHPEILRNISLCVSVCIEFYINHKNIYIYIKFM